MFLPIKEVGQFELSAVPWELLSPTVPLSPSPNDFLTVA